VAKGMTSRGEENDVTGYDITRGGEGPI